MEECIDIKISSLIRVKKKGNICTFVVCILNKFSHDKTIGPDRHTFSA